jgi:DNA-binding NtrC family response regulator
MAEHDGRMVLVVHRVASMRRIVRCNLEMERIPTREAASVAECLTVLRFEPPSALLLDPEVLVDHDEALALQQGLDDLHIPVLVLSSGREHRHVADAFGHAPFCNRPDDVERVTAAVRVLAGARLPLLV